MRNRGRLIALLLVVAYGTPAAAQQAASSVPTVAVLDFTGISLVPGEDAAAVGQSLSTMVATELTGREGVQVLDRQQVDRLLRARQISLSGISDELAQEIGRLLGAHYLVLGNVTLEKERARIDVRLLDVETGLIHRAENRRGDRDEFLDLVEEVADAFTRNLEVPVRVADADLEIPVEASIAYSRGLDYERRGMWTEAERMFRRALEMFPAHEPASSALERVKAKGA